MAFYYVKFELNVKFESFTLQSVPKLNLSQSLHKSDKFRDCL